MSNFLARIAARAVGESAGARPRVPALFEQAEATGGTTLELVEEEVVAPVRPRPARDETTAYAEHRVAPTPPPNALLPSAAEGATGPHAAAPSAPRLPEIAPRPSSSRPERDAHDPERSTPSSAAAPPTAIPALAVPPALPAVVGAPEAAAPGPAAAAREDLPPVRVHIGRLDVRANLQQTLTEQPRREPSRPEGLSLADYLRGKREVR